MGHGYIFKYILLWGKRRVPSACILPINKEHKVKSFYPSTKTELFFEYFMLQSKL